MTTNLVFPQNGDYPYRAIVYVTATFPDGRQSRVLARSWASMTFLQRHTFSTGSKMVAPLHRSPSTLDTITVLHRLVHMSVRIGHPI